MKHCNLPFTKCCPLFCILSNFDTSGGEYLHQFVQYSSFLHFKVSSRITCVNILCHTCTTCLIIKILNDKENKLSMIIRNCQLGKKSEHSLPEKVSYPLKYTHTTYFLQISHQKTQPLCSSHCCHISFSSISRASLIMINFCFSLHMLPAAAVYKVHVNPHHNMALVIMIKQ